MRKFNIILLCFLAIFSNALHAQYEMVFEEAKSQLGCNYDFKLNVSMYITKIKIVKIYSDDGYQGSFAYEVYFDIDNKIETNQILPDHEFWRYQLVLTSNRQRNSMTNNFRLPIKSGYYKDMKLENNPTYNGSAIALGFEEGKEYTSYEILNFFNYETAELTLLMECLDTTIHAMVVPPSINPLPVTLKSFTINDNNELKWVTSQEDNFKYFVVERSDNGSNWYAQDTVSPLSNAYSASEYHYSWIDKNVSNASYVMYRLKMVDVDGKFNYSKVVKGTSINNAISLRPNPASEYIEFNGLANQLIFIYDFSGKMVFTGYLDTNARINIKDFKPGTYILTSESIHPMKFIKI